MKRLLVALLAGILPVVAVGAETVQIDVRPILNGRSVTTLTKGQLIPWTKGVDGGGKADGYMTLEAAIFNGDQGPKALPGDGRFPANAQHPEVQLNFSNADGVNAQTRGIVGEGSFSLKVPARPFAQMYLFMTSAEGPSRLEVRLDYADATSDVRTVLLPDYYNDASAETPGIFALASNLAKWNAAGRMAEADHHYIHGVDLHPNERKLLVQIRVHKPAPAYLVFWGATGVTKD